MIVSRVVAGLLGLVLCCHCGGSTETSGGGASGAGGSGGSTGGSGGSAGTSPSGGSGGSDAGPDTGGVPDAGCPSDQVRTIEGCMTCDALATRVSAIKTAAQEAHEACAVKEDCVLTSADTGCSGACPVPVAKSGEAAYRATLDQLTSDYCADAPGVCGFSSPGCAAGEAACELGKCVWVPL